MFNFASSPCRSPGQTFEIDDAGYPLTGDPFDDYDGLNVLAFFVKNNNMDFFSYLVNHPNPNEIYNAQQKDNTVFFVKGNLASEPSLLMYTSYIFDTVSDLIESFRMQPSTITRSITHNFVMRMNQTIDFRGDLSYQINPCESLSPFVFTAHTRRELNGAVALDAARVEVSNTIEMGSWKGVLGSRTYEGEPFVYPGRGTFSPSKNDGGKLGKLYQGGERYYPSHQFSPDLACENAFLGRVSFETLGAADDWMMFRVVRFAMFRNPLAAMKVGFNVTGSTGALEEPKYTQGWRTDSAFGNILDSDIQLMSSFGVDAGAAKTYVAAQAGVTSANLNVPMVNPEPRIPVKEYLTEDKNDWRIMQTVLVLKVRRSCDTVYVSDDVFYSRHIDSIQFCFFDF